MPRFNRRSTVGGLDAPWNQELEQRMLANRGVLSHGPTQGRKSDGMNSRYDRMIATVNIMPTPESHNKRRRRSSSASGSSSLVSYDVPKTPVDAHNDLEGGRLGEDFAIIKMGQPRKELASHISPSFSMNYFDNDPKEKEDVPAWLSTAMSNVGAHHPIRALIPKEKAHTSAVLTPRFSPFISEAAPPPSAHINPSTSVVDDDPFAFRVPSRGQCSPQNRLRVESENRSVNEHVVQWDYGQESQYMMSLPLEEQLPSSPHPSLHARSALNKSITHRHSPSPTPNFPLANPGPFSPDVLSPNMSPLAHNHSSAVPAPSEDVADFAPFSIPGPFAAYSAHTLSRSMLHNSSSPLRASSRVYTSPEPDISLNVDFPPADAALPFSTPGPLACLPPPPCLRSDTNRTGLPRSSDDFEQYLVSEQAIPESLDAEHTSSSDLPIDAYLATPEPPFRQPPLSHAESYSSSTPAPKRIYFDYPAEDPIGSDPLSLQGYELNLDYDLLDFRWERFDRSRAETHDSGVEMQQVIGASHVRDEASVQDDESIIQEASTSQQLGALDLRNVAQQSQSPALTQNMEAIHEQPHVAGSVDRDTPEPPPIEDKENMPPESSQRPSFAPAPGIFISPLRGDVSVEQDDTRAPQDTIEIKADSDTMPIGAEKFESKICDTDAVFDNSPPRTPVNQSAFSVPRTPTAPRNNRMSTPMSIPKIAVLSQKDVSDDEIDDPDGEACSQALRQVSQDSHDTIESWSDSNASNAIGYVAKHVKLRDPIARWKKALQIAGKTYFDQRIARV